MCGRNWVKAYPDSKISSKIHALSQDVLSAGRAPRLEHLSHLHRLLEQPTQRLVIRPRVRRLPQSTLREWQQLPHEGV